MVHMRLPAILVLSMFALAASAQGQIAEDLQREEMHAATPTSDAALHITKELSFARRTGNIARVRELESTLFEVMPSLPEGLETIVRPAIDALAPEETAGPLWGNDVTIFTGPVWANGKRQLAIDADTVGGIYVAVNTRYQDSNSVLRLYRSTNQGRNWTALSGFYAPGYAIQSFDMCVTDTTGGKWLIGCAFILKTDRSAIGGGHLYWGSVLSDGTDWRALRIAAASSSINFRNPSICTDGTVHAPSLTYHYIAAEFVDPATDLSRGIYITRTTTWGKTWTAPDTSIGGFVETGPVIAIDWSTSPDSLCIAFNRHISGLSGEIRMGRNSFTANGGWKISGIVSEGNEIDPSMAIDPVRGNAIVTYTRISGPTGYDDAMYLYSTDLFKTFTRDSIDTGTGFQQLTSVGFAPSSGSNYYWRVVYRTSAEGGAIYYKSLYNNMKGFFNQTAIRVSQYRPASTLVPIVGFDRGSGGTYLGNCVYVGTGDANVYFDAVDLSLDVPRTKDLPGRYALDQNYPNPFNPSTTIRYGLQERSHVSLAVFNTLGQKVIQLVNGELEAGYHEVKFEGEGLTSGVYLCRMQAGDFVQTRKMLLVQ